MTTQERKRTSPELQMASQERKRAASDRQMASRERKPAAPDRQMACQERETAAGKLRLRANRLSARFNQTERGSFVFSVSCPINALNVQAPLPLHGEALPFVRLTTWTINCALQALVDAVETDTMDRLVEEPNVPTDSSCPPICARR
jgi:hypothetical protein